MLPTKNITRWERRLTFGNTNPLADLVLSFTFILLHAVI